MSLSLKKTCEERFKVQQKSNTKFIFVSLFPNVLCQLKLVRCSVVVKALCYKKEGRGFDTRGDFLNLPNPSGRTRPRGLLSL
jgi:hypothetical protein